MQETSQKHSIKKSIENTGFFVKTNIMLEIKPKTTSKKNNRSCKYNKKIMKLKELNL